MDMQAVGFMAIAFAAVMLLVPMAIVRGSYQLQEVSEAWRKLAERHRLDYKPRRRVRGATVTGSLAGRDFLLKRAGGNKNNGAVFMELELEGSLPAGLELHPVDQTADVLATLTGTPRHMWTGEEIATSISEKVKIDAADPESIDAYLTPERARAALELVEMGGSVEKHRIKLKVNQIAAELEELDRVLGTLRRVAPVFEQH